jgi:hypothetical protein
MPQSQPTTRPNKNELFRRLLKSEGIAPRPIGIPQKPGPREGEASFAQRRLWVKQMLDPQSTVYNILLAMRIEGQLSCSAVSQSLQAIVDRHESLRTCFRVVRGHPYQTVYPTVTVTLNYAELIGQERQQNVLSRVLASTQQKRFPLATAPLFEFTLVRLEKEVNILLIALHHIISDFVSSQILLGEFSQMYKTYVCGLPCCLPELRVQYLDYSNWEAMEFQTSARDSTVEYWKE